MHSHICIYKEREGERGGGRRGERERDGQIDMKTFFLKPEKCSNVGQ